MVGEDLIIHICGTEVCSYRCFFTFLRIATQDLTIEGFISCFYVIEKFCFIKCDVNKRW